MTKGINESIDQTSAKYSIYADFTISGVVEVQDIIGALFGQTEGLLNDLELRELQKSGRIGRIVVNAKSESGKTSGEIIIPSSLDRTETAILAATLETVDRVGPCAASLTLREIRDLRESKLKQIESRAKELLKDWKARSAEKEDLSGKINIDLEKDSIITWNGLPAGAEIDKANTVIIVEGRNDIQQLLKIGLKNTVAVNGTSIPKAIIDLTNEKECTAFLDGDRGGEMILNELLQVSKIKFIARAPPNHEVEELNEKELTKALQNKVPVDYLLKERKHQEQQDRDKDRRDRDNRDRRDTRESRDNRFGNKGRDSREQRDSRDNRRGEETRERRPPQSGSRGPAPIKSSPNIPRQYAPMVKELVSSNEGIVLDDKDQIILRTSNVKMINELPESFSTLIVDGILSQRVLDKALAKKTQRVIAVNASDKLKIPEESKIEIYFFRDFL
jgi:DNA primase